MRWNDDKTEIAYRPWYARKPVRAYDGEKHVMVQRETIFRKYNENLDATRSRFSSIDDAYEYVTAEYLAREHGRGHPRKIVGDRSAVDVLLKKPVKTESEG